MTLPLLILACNYYAVALVIGLMFCGCVKIFDKWLASKKFNSLPAEYYSSDLDIERDVYDD